MNHIAMPEEVILTQYPLAN